MKFVVFLAIAVAAVASLPLETPTDQDADLAFIKWKIVIEGEDPKNGKWRHEIRFPKNKKEKVEKYSGNIEQGLNLADLPPEELAKFKIKISGNIKINIKFSNPIAMEENNAELAHAGCSIRMDKEELNKLVEEELARLGMKIDDVSHLMKFELVEMENPEILESTDVDSLTDPELAKFKIKIGGNIKINIKFSNPLAMEDDAELAASKHVWVECSNGKRHLAYSMKYNAEKVAELHVEDVELIPSPEVAKPYINGVALQDRNGIRILSTLGTKFNGQEIGQQEIDLADIPAEELAKFKIKISGNIKISIKFSSLAPVEPDSSINIDEKELGKHVQEELAKLGIKTEGVSHLMKFEVIEMENAEAMPIIDVSSLTEPELAKFKIKIGGNIKIHIKFCNPMAMGEDNAELARNTDSSNEFNAEVNKLELQDVEIMKQEL